MKRTIFAAAAAGSMAFGSAAPAQDGVNYNLATDLIEGTSYPWASPLRR